MVGCEQPQRIRRQFARRIQHAAYFGIDITLARGEQRAETRMALRNVQTVRVLRPQALIHRFGAQIVGGGGGIAAGRAQKRAPAGRLP